MLLERLNQVAHRAARQIQQFCGLRKAVGLDHAGEDFHCLEAVHTG
jgi:hypothetical protein